MALERIDSSGIPGSRSSDLSPLQTSLSQGQLPIFLKKPSCLSHSSQAPGVANAPLPSPVAAAAAAAASDAAVPAAEVCGWRDERWRCYVFMRRSSAIIAPKYIAGPSHLPITQAAATTTPRDGAIGRLDSGIIGHVGSPRARPLTAEDTPRIIQVDVVEEVEADSDGDLTNPGDVDEYSVSDVAGEASDEEFDFVVDASGDLVFVPEEGEGGEDGAQAATAAAPSPQFYEAIESAVSADGAAAVAEGQDGGASAGALVRNESYRSTEAPGEDAV
jgi:hypothetical protein